jgi:hypothetical protein
MAKKTITLFDDVAPSGVSSLPIVDLSAHESAAFYFKLANKPSGSFTYNLYAHEPVTNTSSTVAGGVLTANGTQRTLIPHLYEERYFLEFNCPAAGAEVTAVLVVEDV